MKRFNTFAKRIVTPALVIALSAGAAMAAPGHLSGTGHHSGAAALHAHVAVPGSTEMTAQPKATTSTKKEDAAFKVKKQIAESGGSVHTEIQMLYNNKCKHGCSSDLSDNLILWYSILAPVNINH